jgi:hypothetical protein
MKHITTKRKVTWRSNNEGKKYASISIPTELVFGKELLMKALDEKTVLLTFVD